MTTDPNQYFRDGCGRCPHFAQPKQSKTRTSRIEKCTPKIMDGIGLND